jgi:hypothetical protein
MVSSIPALSLACETHPPISTALLKRSNSSVAGANKARQSSSKPALAAVPVARAIWKGCGRVKVVHRADEI